MGMGDALFSLVSGREISFIQLTHKLELVTQQNLFQTLEKPESIIWKASSEKKLKLNPQPV